MKKYQAYVMAFYRMLRKDARRHTRLVKQQRAAREAGVTPSLSLTLVRDNIRLIDEKTSLLRHERRMQEALLLGIARGAPLCESTKEENSRRPHTVVRRTPSK